MRNEVNAVILSVRSHGFFIFVKQEQVLVVAKQTLAKRLISREIELCWAEARLKIARMT